MCHDRVEDFDILYKGLFFVFFFEKSIFNWYKTPNLCRNARYIPLVNWFFLFFLFYFQLCWTVNAYFFEFNITLLSHWHNSATYYWIIVKKPFQNFQINIYKSLTLGEHLTFKDKLIPSDNGNELNVQTVPRYWRTNLLPVMFSQSTDWKQLFTCTSNCLFGVFQLLVRLQADGCILIEGPVRMICCSTTQLMPFQSELYCRRITCRCYVNSSLHLLSCPVVSNHMKKNWNHSVVWPPPHVCCFIDCCAMPAAPCTVIFQTSGICAPVTQCHVVSESAFLSQLRGF